MSRKTGSENQNANPMKPQNKPSATREKVKAPAAPVDGARQRGRPSIRTPELEELIVLWLSDGRPLRELCRKDGMPARETVDAWRRDDASFAARVARARDIGFDQLAEETLAIADDGTNDYVDREGRNGVMHTEFDAEHVQRSRLRVDTRLKLLACWDPRRYGQKLAVGGDASGVPIQLSDVERAARIQKLLAVAAARKAQIEAQVQPTEDEADDNA